MDDFQAIRRGIRSLLSSDPSLTICGEAVDGLDALAKATALRPDLIVMDISMPNLNGLEATREIKLILPEIKIIIVSQHDAPEMARVAFEAGAQEFITKTDAATKLLAAISRLTHPQTSTKTGSQANADERGPDTPRRLLSCPECNYQFTHDEISIGVLANSSWLDQPDLPKAGISLGCPGCGKNSIYQRDQFL